MMEQLNVSERRVCRALNQPRSTQRYRSKIRVGEERLIEQMTDLATKYGRYGYRRITALLQREGWEVNYKRVEHLWRKEGLKVPQKQPKKKRLWLNDGSCIRRRPQFKDHVWSYDFVATRTMDCSCYVCVPRFALAPAKLMARQCQRSLRVRLCDFQFALPCQSKHRGTPPTTCR